MFKRLRVKPKTPIIDPASDGISISQLIGDASLSVSIKAINSLPQNPKLRLYRALIPLQILAEMDINPRTWKNPEGQVQVKLGAEKESNTVQISVWYGPDPANEFFFLELADNPYNGIDLNFVEINDPRAPKFNTDVDEEGRATRYGKVFRNLDEEQNAMQAGLTPGQIRRGLRSSGLVFTHIETFLTVMAHHALTLEPLTYASALIFEKRGFAYMRGHKLMDTIHKEFQPGGELHKALDASTPFRTLEQWKTVRGRAWAIHDGILETIDQNWDGVKMVKQIGRHAGVNTFPQGEY